MQSPASPFLNCAPIVFTLGFEFVRRPPDAAGSAAGGAAPGTKGCFERRSMMPHCDDHSVIDDVAASVSEHSSRPTMAEQDVSQQIGVCVAVGAQGGADAGSAPNAAARKGISEVASSCSARAIPVGTTAQSLRWHAVKCWERGVVEVAKPRLVGGLTFAGWQLSLRAGRGFVSHSRRREAARPGCVRQSPDQRRPPARRSEQS